MSRKEKKYHYIYKIICNETKKFYIGMHSTSNLEDGYMGSGYRIKRSIKKYGINKHTKEILEFLPDRKSLKEREKELVNEDILKDKMCMNLKTGGHGGFSSNQQKINAKKSNQKQKILKETNKEWVIKRSKNSSLGNLRAYESGVREKKYFFDWNGKKHSEETKQKLRKPKNIGEKNSQFGTMWITNGIENKKIKKEDPIPQGWNKGRK